MILDAGPLIEIDRNPRLLAAIFAIADSSTYPQHELATNQAVVGQVWRDGKRQALLAVDT